MSDLQFKSASDLAGMLRRREVGARELLDHFAARKAAHNPTINAIIVDTMAGAQAAADAADARLTRGEPCGPLDGLPMTVKESFNLASTPTTWGIPALRDSIAEHDAVAVERLKAAGAVIFGKTNVPIHLSDWQSFNEIYGTTNNPWDLTRSPGGSSGGSAAALATGMTGLEIGSDIGSSVRDPAHYCGVYGHKPTYGVVPMTGHMLPEVLTTADISVAGPLARGAADLDLALSVLAGPDGPEARAYRLDLPPAKKARLADFKVAIIANDDVAEVDQPVQDLIIQLGEFLAKEGATVHFDARPAIDSRRAFEVYIALLRAATSGRQTAEEFARNKDIAAGLARDDHSYYAEMLRAMTMGYRDWLTVDNDRRHMMLRWEAFFEDYDLLLTPVASSAAFPHDQQGERHERTITVNGKQVPTTDQLFWAGYSCAFYLPGTSAPIGLTGDGLPVGVQINGPRYADRTCIHFARLLEDAYHRFVPPPDFA